MVKAIKKIIATIINGQMTNARKLIAKKAAITNPVINAAFRYAIIQASGSPAW